jgi:hypothetical protein
MDSVSKFIILCALLYSICRQSLILPAVIRTVSAQLDLGQQPAMYPQQQPMSPQQQPLPLLNGQQESSSNNDKSGDPVAGAQTRLLEMLQGTRKKLAELTPFESRQCSEFNWTLNEAYHQLDGLVKLGQNQLESVEPNYAAGPSAMGQLHEQMDAMRQLKAMNAYEALGSSMTLYFECLAQLGQSGLARQLESLLPISVNMGTLGGLMDAAVPPSSFGWMLNSNQAAAPADGATAAGEQGAVSTSEAPNNDSASFLNELGSDAHKVYEEASNFFG